DARIELTGEMQGELVRTDGEAVAVSVPPGRGWKGKLEAGRYRLDVVWARPNNRVTYQIGVWPEELVAGLDREVSAPGTVPLSVGRDGLVQLASFGSADVRARVYDAADHLVAENDDGADDWNFQIQARLAAGAYRLHVEPVGRTAATTIVSMRAPEEAAEAPLALPVKAEVALDGPGVFRVGGGVRACSVPDVPCREPANGVVAATGKTLWLVRDRARKTLRATRVVLAPGAARQLQVELDGERPAQLDVANPTGDGVLVVATSLAGQPGVVLAEPGAPASPRAAVQGMAVGPHSAVSVALSGKRPTAVVWTASPSLVTVREWSVPLTMVRGEFERSPDGALEDVGGLARNVDFGPQRLRLALGEATVAVLSDGGHVTSVPWQGGEPFEET